MNEVTVEKELINSTVSEITALKTTTEQQVVDIKTLKDGVTTLTHTTKELQLLVNKKDKKNMALKEQLIKQRKMILHMDKQMKVILENGDDAIHVIFSWTQIGRFGFTDREIGSQIGRFFRGKKYSILVWKIVICSTVDHCKMFYLSAYC